MTSHIACPNCGHEYVPETRTPVQELEVACRERGLFVTVDGRVTEQVAADLLGRAPGTLANWAYSDRPLPFVKVSGRRTYRLSDLAEFLRKGSYTNPHEYP